MAEMTFVKSQDYPQLIADIETHGYAVVELDYNDRIRSAARATIHDSTVKEGKRVYRVDSLGHNHILEWSSSNFIKACKNARLEFFHPQQDSKQG